ncbi:CapA family protein, partial [Candidatus Saccharibacteria bacterium]|nr:CapA family protein [Candidatus Saccharibacteria bacterium]
KNLNVLRSARIDTVSLANNHVLDFEYEAMDEMLQLLDNTKIAHAGAGRDRYLASMPATVQKGKVRIGLIAFTDNEPGWEAGKNRPGVFYVPIDVDDHRSQVLLSLVEKIKRQVNCLVVSAHWGGNWGYQPPPEHPPFARALIDAGADIIFGHSTHVFRGIEIYKGRPILYSTGDFIDDYAVDEIERNDESFIFMIETQPTHTTGYDPIAGRSEIKRLTLYPTVIDNFQARLAGVRAQAIAAKMTQLCQNLGTKTIWRPERQYLQIPLA